MLHEIRELRFDILHDGRTAGACEKSLFGELLCLCHSNHICAKSCLDNIVDPEIFQSCYDLTELSVRELA